MLLINENVLGEKVVSVFNQNDLKPYSKLIYLAIISSELTDSNKALSYDEIMYITGIKSKKTVTVAISDLREKGLVSTKKRTQKGYIFKVS